MKILACGILLALSTAALGAVAVVQHVSNHAYGDGVTVACALSSTGSARNLIVGAIYSSTVGHGPVAVSSVTDNKGNTYTQATGSSAVQTGNSYSAEIWHALNAISAVTSVTVTLNGPNRVACGATAKCAMYRAIFCYEVSGTGVTFDTAAKVDNGVCSAGACVGASIVTATSTGFVLGIISGDPATDATSGEFTSGGDIDADGRGTSASLVSSTAAGHAPAWHSAWSDRNGAFVSATAAYKQ